MFRRGMSGDPQRVGVVRVQRGRFRCWTGNIKSVKKRGTILECALAYFPR